MLQQHPPDAEDATWRLLQRSEEELASTRSDLARAQTVAAQRGQELEHLDRHAAALDAEMRRFQAQARDRAAELGELRAELGARVLVRQEVDRLQDEDRRNVGPLRREIAVLRPQAASNRVATAALRAMRLERDGLREQVEALKAACDDLRHALNSAQSRLTAVTASRSWRASAPLRRLLALAKRTR